MGRRLRTLTASVAAVALAPSRACSVDFYARRLVTHSTAQGKIGLWLTGSAERLINKGKITSHHRISAPDGTPLDVWVIKGRPNTTAPGQTGGQPGRGTVVLLHSLLVSKARLLRLARSLADMGYDAVLPDLRAHGRSGGKHITFGAKEKHDVKAIVDTLLGRGAIAQPLYVFGQSMGAATAILYAAIDPRCRAVAAVAPYKDLHSIARRFVPLMRRQKYEKVLIRAGRIAGFDPQEACTLAAVKKLTVPLLVVHGRLDGIVPYRHGRAVYQAASCPKQLITFPLRGHISLLLKHHVWFARQVDALARQARIISPTPAGVDLCP